jgi:hypothetical protein
LATVSLTLLIRGGDTLAAVLLFKVFLKLETNGCTIVEAEAMVLRVASGDDSIRIDNR